MTEWCAAALSIFKPTANHACRQTSPSTNCLTFSYSMGDRTWRFGRPGQDEQVRVRGNLRANHSETLREAALASLGLILMPTWLIGGDLAQGRLRSVLTD